MLALLLSFVLSGHTLTLTVTPVQGARLVDVEVGNDDYYRASSFYTDESACPRGHCRVVLRNLPSGQFALWVTQRGEHRDILRLDKRGFYLP